MGINGTTVGGTVNGASLAGRRRHRRKSVLWAARIKTDDGDDLDCAAFDLSLGGAKLKLDAPVALHRPMLLVLERHGAIRAEAVWRRGSTLGVTFVDSPDAVREILGGALSL